MPTDPTAVDAEVIEVSPEWLALLAGRKMFKDGKPRPANTWTDAEWRGPSCAGQCRWLGWMLERAVMLREQDRIRSYIEEGDDL